MLRQAMTAPRFDDEPVDRIRSQMLVSIDREEENPDAIAGRKLNDILFPNHHMAGAKAAQRKVCKPLPWRI